MEDGKGEKFPSTHTSNPDGRTESVGFSNTVVAVSGFTTILVFFALSVSKRD